MTTNYTISITGFESLLRTICNYNASLQYGKARKIYEQFEDRMTAEQRRVAREVLDK